MAGAFTAFAKALRAALGLGAAKGLTAKGCGAAMKRGRAFMPPLMISVFDAETRLSIAERARRVRQSACPDL